MRIENIRNFCIIAHIDHGKSTLADRMLLKTGAISLRDFRDQVLDDMDLERERGITIKASAVTVHYQRGGVDYMLNLIDTPGHVDFSYEVSRSLGACEGALLLVDATQGVEAQTVANNFLAMEHDLKIVPVVNKIDLASARFDEVVTEMEHSLGVDGLDVLKVSAKEGVGIDEVLDAIIDRVPPPQGDPKAPLQALIFDSEFNEFCGVIIYTRVVNGSVRAGEKIRMMATNRTAEVTRVGIFSPKMVDRDRLSAGEVGYIIANIKTIHDVDVGDTITAEKAEGVPRLKGYVQPQPMVYCGLYPANDSEFTALRDALDKLSLNDSSFWFEPESSDALGFGFRCGFLGMLHMEIVQERLERDYDLSLIKTAPNVTYEIVKTTGEVVRISSPSQMPDQNYIDEMREPIVEVSFLLPADSIGQVMKLLEDRRGTYRSTEFLSPTRAMLIYQLPLAEIIYDFYDKLKSVTRGYGTMDYDLLGYKPADLVKLDIVVGGSKVDALSFIVHKAEAERRGRKLVQALRKEIPRHLFEVALQAAIGNRVIARETIAAMKKNVTAKCYGGDISRKRKLWEKQKEGKKRMKSVGRVEVPQSAFLAVLSVDRSEQ